MSTSSSVLVGCTGQEVWVRVEGRASFQNSAGLKEFSKKMIQKGFRQFVVDLEKCELMDSTFMGTLAGIALRLREIGQGSMETINVNVRNTNLLASLGLDQLFKVRRPGDTEAPHLPGTKQLEEPKLIHPVDPRATVLAAHQALVAAQPENALRFKDVLDYLKQENHQNPPDY